MAFPSFDPRSCAALHNRLVAYLFDSALEDRPVLTCSYTESFHLAFLKLAANIDIVHEPILDFFFLIQNYDSVAQSFSRLTPLVLKPDPNAFFRFRDKYPWGEMKGVILLYPGAKGSGNEGLLFDTCTGLAHWANAPNWPQKDDWIPLERVLQMWVNLWHDGKYCRIGGGLDVEIVPWTSHDLNATVDAWVILLQTIHRHSPASDVDSRGLQLGPPLSHGLVWRLTRQSFAVEFLLRAFKPPFRYIAPGIQVLTEFTLRDMLQAKSMDSSRGEYRRRGKDDCGEQSCILFPSDRSVRLCRASAACCNQERSWEFSANAVPSNSGVYLTPCGTMGDGVTFVEHTGRLDSFQYRGPCPWAPRRHLKLVEMLAKWADLVETGVWEVGHDGVKGGHEWFDVQHAKEQQFLDGLEDSEEGNRWGQGDSRMLEMPKDSRMVWGSEDEEVHDGWGDFDIFKGVFLRRSWLDCHF
ncbi:hypothetical protein MMC22_011703 [Lobaria immixta]|nr:hypothetical protein [Lobaria immixta]